MIGPGSLATPFPLSLRTASGFPSACTDAVRAARAAFEGPWSRFKPAERQAVLLRLADLVDAEFQDLALLDVIEMGRPITAAMGLRGMLQRSLRHFAGAATAIHGETLSNSFPVDLLSYTLKEPVGVVGARITSHSSKARAKSRATSARNV